MMISNAHGEKPLMLKDFLELDPNSYSTGTVRYLLDAEICCGSSHIRSRPKSGAFSRISAVIKNLHHLSSSRTRTNKTKSFSKKLISESFWKKRVKESDLPSPVFSSSSSSCSEGDGSSESVEFVLSSNGSFDCSTTGKDGMVSAVQSPERNMASDDSENKEECQGCLISKEDKEQLSPLSVMDFLYQDDADDEEATSSSPCFDQSLANIERTKHELLQKIRRFESLAELDPIDLAASFTSAEDHVDSEEDDTESDLIQRLKFDGYPVGPHKKILLDFFAQGMTLDAEVEELLLAAEDWIRGYGHLDVDDHGKVLVEELGTNGRWRCFELEKEEVVADVEVEVLGLVVDELVLDVLLLGLPQSSE